MSIASLLPQEAFRSPIPVISPNVITFSENLIEIEWYEQDDSEGNTFKMQPFLLQISAWCCPEEVDGAEENSIIEPYLWLASFIKIRGKPYSLRSFNVCKKDTVYLQSIEGRYQYCVQPSSPNCDPVAPFDSRITFDEFETNIDRWVALSDNVNGIKQDFILFDPDFAWCSPESEFSCEGRDPGWYASFSYLGGRISSIHFLHSPFGIPNECENLGFIIDDLETAINSVLSQVIEGISDLVVSRFPLVGNILDFLISDDGDVVRVEIFCCPNNEECPDGYIRNDDGECQPPPEDNEDNRVPTFVSENPSPLPDGGSPPQNLLPPVGSQCLCNGFLLKWELKWYSASFDPSNGSIGQEILDETWREALTGWDLQRIFYEVQPNPNPIPPSSFYQVKGEARGTFTGSRVIWRPGQTPKDYIYPGVRSCSSSSQPNSIFSITSLSNWSRRGTYSVSKVELTSFSLEPLPGTLPTWNECGYPDVSLPNIGGKSCVEGWWTVLTVLISKKPILGIKPKTLIWSRVPGNQCQYPTISEDELPGIYAIITSAGVSPITTYSTNLFYELDSYRAVWSPI